MQCPETTTFEVKGEPKQNQTEVSAYQPNALPPGQTGSPIALRKVEY